MNAHLDKQAIHIEQNDLHKSNEKPLQIMILSDPHIVDKYSHPFNRIHEWRMTRAFKAVMFIHSPELIFILGDVLDRGDKTYSDRDFEDYIEKFKNIFPSNPKSYKIKIIAGNHDIGFHYDITYKKDRRFRRAFYGDSRTSCGRIFSQRGVHFVLLNSMAFEGDDCSLCSEAQRDLDEISKKFSCLRSDILDSSLDCRLPTNLAEKSDRIKHQYDIDSDILKPGTYSRPIVLQHFPLYRKNDLECDKDAYDAMPENQRATQNRPKWETLSKNASETIVRKLRPRLVVSGHTHYGCQIEHKINTDLSESVLEYSTASFTTRNLKHPNFILMRATPYDYSIHKCYVPPLNTVLASYVIGLIIIICQHLSVFHFLKKLILKKRVRYAKLNRESVGTDPLLESEAEESPQPAGNVFGIFKKMLPNSNNSQKFA